MGVSQGAEGESRFSGTDWDEEICIVEDQRA